MDWEKFAQYVGLQGVLVVLLTIGIILGFLFGLVIPSELYGFLGVAWGFYFGKNGRSVTQAVRSVKDGKLSNT